VVDLAKVIQRAIKRDGRSLYRLAIDAGLPYATVHRFANGEREGITLHTASRLCEPLGLELKPGRDGET
jgi:DNA-binding Xre family transcriptional regulator